MMILFIIEMIIGYFVVKEKYKDSDGCGDNILSYLSDLAKPDNSGIVTQYIRAIISLLVLMLILYIFDLRILMLGINVILGTFIVVYLFEGYKEIRYTPESITFATIFFIILEIFVKYRGLY